MAVEKRHAFSPTNAWNPIIADDPVPARFFIGIGMAPNQTLNGKQIVTEIRHFIRYKHLPLN